MHKGILYAGAAYTLWGFLPIYWKALQGAAAVEVLAHRMVWSLGVVLLLLGFQRHWGWLRGAFRNPRTMLTFFATASVLAVNWGLYIWAVQAGYIIETSLGYFINPLVNVLLGFIFLKERLRPGQVAAILLALGGVLYLTFSYGALPWIALILAASFGTYGLLRKTATLNSLEGLTVETLIYFVPALSYLLLLEWSGDAAFGHAGAATTALLAFSGAVTALPLLLFAAGARLITMTTLGILQYIAPTIQFFLGVFVYNEPLSMERLLGFCIIWLALAIYTGEGVMRGRGRAGLRAAVSES